VKRVLGNGFELDDDPRRVDVAAVHAFLTEHAYWALGRTLERQQELVSAAGRVVGLYHRDRQIGFTRTVSDGNSIAYLADVYVLPEYRRRGFGAELVRASVDEGPYADVCWVLHTEDAHGLYRRFGFGTPRPKLMELPPKARRASRPGTRARSGSAR
jgi:ribosomal protein S18 acetylase RimI-like enzyme